MDHIHDNWDLATTAIHGDRDHGPSGDVAPPIHVTTTFERGEAGFSYSRENQPTRSRLEALLGRLEGGFALTYPSGQSAATAILRHWRPRRVAIDRGYFGTRELLELYPWPGIELVELDAELSGSDMIWLETPKNPGCEIEDIAAQARRAARSGATLVVDSTLATPLLQRPLGLGADVVVHSTSKFIAGHSDALGGVLAVRDEAIAGALRAEREAFGEIPGALESWLTLRGLRTLQVRIARQSATAESVARWLQGVVARVLYPALESHPQHAIFRRQMRGGGGVLAFELGSGDEAKAVAGELALFRRAVSLGGVESLVDWRHELDCRVPASMLRLSIGLESARDLIADLRQALSSLPVEPGGCVPTAVAHG